MGDGREGVGGGGEGVRGSRRGHGPRRKGGIRAQSCLSHAAHVRPVEGRAGEQHVPAGGRRSERAGRGGERALTTIRIMIAVRIMTPIMLIMTMLIMTMRIMTAITVFVKIQ